MSAESSPLIAIDENIWFADGPTVPFMIKMPYPTRMVVIRLASGDLFVWSPIALTDSLRTAVLEIGTVRHIVSPNKIHHLFMGDWADAFPGSKLYASPGLPKRRKDLTFASVLGDDAPADWSEEIDQIIFRGSFFMKELLFFHRSSRTLIIADLIENFDLKTLSIGWRLLAKFWRIAAPDGRAPREYIWSFLNRRAARRSLKTILAWQPERIIVAHGLNILENGVEELKQRFAWVGPMEK